MKPKLIYLVFVALLCVLPAAAQDISIDELKELQRQDLDDANVFLTGRGWHLHKTTKPNEKEYGDATWVIAREDSSDDVSFFKYYYAPGKYSRVAYIFSESKYYQALLGRIKKMNLKKQESWTGDNMIVSDYELDAFVLSVSVFADTENKTTFYTFMLFDKRDFERMNTKAK